MKKRDEAQYRAKITDDNGLTRGRIPTPLLSQMGARPGDYTNFRLSSSGEAIMSISRSRGAKKTKGKKAGKKRG
jgi:hypothetical protein